MQGAIELARRGWSHSRTPASAASWSRTSGSSARAGTNGPARDTPSGSALDDAGGRALARRHRLRHARALRRRACRPHGALHRGAHRGRRGTCGGRRGRPESGGGRSRCFGPARGGIEVVTGVLADRCRDLNPGFNRRMTSGRPRRARHSRASTAARPRPTGRVRRSPARRRARTCTGCAPKPAPCWSRGTRQADDPSPRRFDVRVAAAAARGGRHPPRAHAARHPTARAMYGVRADLQRQRGRRPEKRSNGRGRHGARVALAGVPLHPAACSTASARRRSTT